MGDLDDDNDDEDDNVDEDYAEDCDEGIQVEKEAFIAFTAEDFYNIGLIKKRRRQLLGGYCLM